MRDPTRFRKAIRHLHAEKDAAYRNSWKRRGELISILANIARKVDRLEYASLGASAAQDEVLLDTAVDLLVYSLKYQTYLADHDGAIAADLFGDTVSASHSDGSSGFEALLEALDLAAVDESEGVPTFAEASGAAVRAFTELERCFPEGQPPAAAGERFKRARNLTLSAVLLAGAICDQMPEQLDDFLTRWGGEDAG